MNITELRQKRADLWEKAKNFLDNAKRDGDILSADDAATYEKMESDIVAMGREIEMLERQAEFERQLNAPVNTPITNVPNGIENAKTGRASNEYKQAFEGYMRRSQPSNELTIGTDADGGYLVPDEFENRLVDKLREKNIIRGLATVIRTSNGDRSIPVVASHGSASWIDESGTYNPSDDHFDTTSLSAYKLGTLIKVSEELLNDSVFSIENYVSTEFARRIGAAEEEAFISGDGIKKPTGILSATGVGGVTAASATAITADEIIDLYYSLNQPYRKNAVFVANDSTVKAIRKLKDSTGQYLWQPGITSNTVDTIMGRPIYTSQYMPAIATGNKTMIFGDLSYYWIADREGRSFQRLNEIYAPQGQVGFRMKERVDGKLILPDAVKIFTQA